MFLNTLFPNSDDARMVVHVGPLLDRTKGATRALRRYLDEPRDRELLLMHHGTERFGDVASDAGVTDIPIAAEDPHGDARTAGEMAVALGAEQLDFAIDALGVVGPDACVRRRVTLREAESLADQGAVPPRIRGKLRAGCEAMRHGVLRVRIGHPEALRRDRATVLVPDPAIPMRVAPPEREHDASRRAVSAAAADPGPDPPEDREDPPRDRDDPSRGPQDPSRGPDEPPGDPRDPPPQKLPGVKRPPLRA